MWQPSGSYFQLRLRLLKADGIYLLPRTRLAIVVDSAGTQLAAAAIK
jgi:hypothetical protein